MVIEQTPIDEIKTNLLDEKGIELFVKREDLNHPEIQGNKLRKLQYNLIKAKEEGHKTILSFGGAYSNHIYALAAAGAYYDFQTIGIIRGEQHHPLNPTLAFAETNQMQLHYMDRTRYRLKNSQLVLNDLKKKFGDFYLIPEGGTNDLAIKGCQEILHQNEKYFDQYILSVGTGGTIAGIIQSLQGQQQVIGISSLKGEFLEAEVNSLFRQYHLPEYNNWTINHSYHMGGYAKVNEELLRFMEQIEQDHGLVLDPVYTGKALYGIFDMIKKDQFKRGTRLLFIHTGGLQGRKGFGI
jgi:1-aminocyclopropane-1-carboxylate deaminase